MQSNRALFHFIQLDLQWNRLFSFNIFQVAVGEVFFNLLSFSFFVFKRHLRPGEWIVYLEIESEMLREIDFGLFCKHLVNLNIEKLVGKYHFWSWIKVIFMFKNHLMGSFIVGTWLFYVHLIRIKILISFQLLGLPFSQTLFKQLYAECSRFPFLWLNSLKTFIFSLICYIQGRIQLPKYYFFPLVYE